MTSPRVADGAEKKRLAEAYGAALVDMEATTIARLAGMRNIPFYCFKGVSDGFTENLLDFNRFISPEGQLETRRLLFFVLPRPWYWPALIRMGENSRKASQSIADSLLDFLDERGHIRKRNGNANLKLLKSTRSSEDSGHYARRSLPRHQRHARRDVARAA